MGRRSRDGGDQTVVNLFPFPLFLSFVQVVLFLADMGRRRRCDTPIMPPLAQAGVGNG